MPRTSNNFDKHIALRIKSRRLQLGISQEQLGDGLQITFQQVQKYESGANRVSAGTLYRISRILQVSPSFFFDGLEGDDMNGQEPTYIDHLSATKDGIALAKAFSAIETPALRHTLVHLIEQISTQ